MVSLSSDEINKIKLEIGQARKDSLKLLMVDEEGTAHIAVSGPLEPKPDACAIMFDIDMTTYQDIIEATRAAESDDNIKKIIYDFDSPGGNVVGLFSTADVIRDAKKPTVGIIHNLCASAALALASQCDTIIAVNEAVEVGSIGVVTERIDRSKSDESRGIRVYTLTSENAPDKRPDVSTEEGRLKIVERITKLESVFIGYVAAGRKTTTDNVKEKFGQGGVLIARDALEVGLIDEIESELQIPGEGLNTTAGTNPDQAGEETMGEITMTDEQLAEFGKNIAKETAAEVTKNVTASFEAREKAQAAEAERKAGFATLLATYPKQKTMIDAEMAKDGANASADFAIRVSEAEKARLAAEKEQELGSDEQLGETNSSSTSVDKSGDDFIALMKGV